MEIKLNDLKRKEITVTFGPLSNPQQFSINMLEEAQRRLQFSSDFNDLRLDVGMRLGEEPYSDTGRAKKGMPPRYLCEGSVWLNFYAPNGEFANVCLVPHLDKTGHSGKPHHNFCLYLADFDGSTKLEKKIEGHTVPIDEPITISIEDGNGRIIRKGTIGSVL